MLRRLAGTLSVMFLAASAVPAAEAQQVLGAGDDAVTIPAGTVRLRGMGQWDWFNQQYDSGGVLHPMRGKFSVDTLGVAQLPVLTALQSELRSLTGNSALNVSLGKTVVSSSGRVETTNLGADFGVTHWLQIGVTVPIVKTRANVAIVTNPTGLEGNVAPNPALADVGSFAQDTAFENQMARAAVAVQAYCATSAGRANGLCANSATLTSTAQALSAGLAQVYNNSLFVPTQRSALQATINSRWQSVVSQLNAYAAIQNSGVTAVMSSGVVAAPTPVLAAQMQQILQDPVYGIAADSLKTIEQLHLGDVEVATKLLLLDSFHGSVKARTDPHGVNGRLAVGVSYRFPTGQASSSDNLVAIPTGTHEAALGVRGFLDVLLGGHFWTSFIAHYEKEQGTDVQLRVPVSPEQAFIPAYATTTVHRTLGNLFEFEATPRWVLNNFMSLTAQYKYRRKDQDRYVGTPYTVGADSLTGGVPVVVDPATLDVGSAFTEHMVAEGISFSNLYAVARHQGSIPVEVMYLHQQTIKGSGDNLPQTFRDQIQMRLYVPIFGK